MSPDYTPIDCHFYDHLETAATQRRCVDLLYFNDLRQLCLGSGVIHTFFIRDKIEFLQLKSGEEIQLDHIIRLDDTPAPLYADYPDFSCSCWRTATKKTSCRAQPRHLAGGSNSFVQRLN